MRKPLVLLIIEFYRSNKHSGFTSGLHPMASSNTCTFIVIPFNFYKVLQMDFLSFHPDRLAG